MQCITMCSYNNAMCHIMVYCNEVEYYHVVKYCDMVKSYIIIRYCSVVRYHVLLTKIWSVEITQVTSTKIWTSFNEYGSDLIRFEYSEYRIHADNKQY